MRKTHNPDVTSFSSSSNPNSFQETEPPGTSNVIYIPSLFISTVDPSSIASNRHSFFVPQSPDFSAPSMKKGKVFNP